METQRTKRWFFALLLGIMMSGCGGTTGGGDDLNGTGDSAQQGGEHNGSQLTGNEEKGSNDKIFVAESNEPDKETYQLTLHPMLYGEKLYARVMKYRSIKDMTLGMKVVEYDLSKLKKDMDFNALPARILHEKTQSTDEINPSFNPRYYNLLKINNKLYFSVLPSSKNDQSQSGRVSYDLSSNTIEYERYDTPVMGKRKDTTFDLTRGWFVPFAHNEYIAVTEEAAEKVMDRATGNSYKYGGYDFLTAGPNDALNKMFIMPPVATDDTFYHASNHFYAIGFLPENRYVEYGRRLIDNDPAFIDKDILTEFKKVYTGTKNYRIANYNGRVLGTPELILDGQSIYQIARMGYDNSNNDTLTDLYLLKYNLQAELQEVTLLETTTSPTANIYAYQPYKYGDNLYFKVHNGWQTFLYSYDLKRHTYNFKYEIGNDNISYYIHDSIYTPYVITGDTIILPDYEASNKSGTYTYNNIVFRVLDINTGTVLETLRHNKLKDLMYDRDRIVLHTALSNNDNVYFLGKKEGEKTLHNIIVRISSPHNKTQKNRYRMDNQFSGVYR